MKSIERLEAARQSFSFIERVLFYLFVILLVSSSALLLVRINGLFLTTVPAYGGTITEGVVGAPRFINPLLAASDPDRDLTQLVYSGLMKATPEGTLIPDLAETYTISDDGQVYTFTLHPKAQFHDGTRVTAEDVVYTVTLAQNPDVKSPRRANWEGVAVKALDGHTVEFTLTAPYQPFLENTTLGILPKHIWEVTPPEQLLFNTYNVEPVGSGPYRVTEVKRNNAGVPERLTVAAFNEYTLGRPYIDEIVMRFYTTEETLLEALHDGEVTNINSISPETGKILAEEGRTLDTFPLPRVFAVFFNQNQNTLFTHIEVRKALEAAVPRKQIVEEILYGYGVPATGPLPSGLSTSQADTNTTTDTNGIAEARAILERNGWALDEEQGVYTNDDELTLSFTITTANTPELKRTAELIQTAWETVGARVDVAVFETGTLNNEVIRPREYEALLFGQIIGRDLDPFPFWHSSQRNDPGLNIALYANITTDNILERIRTTFDPDELTELYMNFEEEIRNDAPAAFVYTPKFIYVIDNNINGVELGTVTTAAERFLNVHEWHKYTDKVWPLFTHN